MITPIRYLGVLVKAQRDTSFRIGSATNYYWKSVCLPDSKIRSENYPVELYSVSSKVEHSTDNRETLDRYHHRVPNNTPVDYGLDRKAFNL